MTGLRRDAIVGKRVREVLPGIEKDPANWIGTYGEVALQGRELRFEQYLRSAREVVFHIGLQPD